MFFLTLTNLMTLLYFAAIFARVGVGASSTALLVCGALLG
jgi:hypothetical protein